MATYQNYKTDGKTYEIVVMTSPDLNQYPKILTLNATVILEEGDIIKDSYGAYLFDSTIKKIICKKESSILGYTNYRIEVDIIRSINPNWKPSPPPRKFLVK